MNTKNLDFLKESLKYLGFGDKLNAELEKNIANRFPEFVLKLDTEINRKPFKAELYFKKSDNTDMYFFNSWDGILKKDEGKLQQTFYINRNHGITLKEGFNLLEGRAVFKEMENKAGQKYQAWVQLNMNEKGVNGNFKVNLFHRNYGYDLAHVLAKYPIKELAIPEQKDVLMWSLQRGNIQGVTFEKNGFAEKLYIEADPQYKGIQVYDHTGARIPAKDLEKRFELSASQNKTDVVLVGRAREPVNGKEVSGVKEKEVRQESGLQKGQEGTEKKEGVATSNSLLPKKQKAEGLTARKGQSKGRGQHL